MLIPATGRQGELKRRTFVGIRCRPEPPTVGLDNREANRQPHTHPFSLRRKEGREKMIETFGLQPDPGVLHCDKNFVGFNQNRSDQQFSRFRDGAHRLDAVHH